MDSPVGDVEEKDGQLDRHEPQGDEEQRTVVSVLDNFGRNYKINKMVQSSRELMSFIFHYFNYLVAISTAMRTEQTSFKCRTAG